MKNIGKKTLGGLVCVSLFGCASIADTSSELGKKMGIENSQGAAAAGGATIGCLGGAVLAYATGNNVAKGCGTGAIAVGAIAAVTVYQQQLDEAKKITAEAKGTPYIVKMTEKPAAQPASQASAPAQPAENRLDTMTLDLPRKSVDSKDPQIATIAKKVALVAARNPNGAVITVEGSKARRDYLSALISQSIPPASQQSVKVESKASTTNTRVTLVSLG